MANPLETGLRYAGSVAERSLGINAFQRWQRYVVENSEPSSDAYRNRKFVGVIIGLIQFYVPATTDSISRMWSGSQYGTKEKANENPLVTVGKYSIRSLPDVASWMLIATTDNLIQLSLYKLAANAATHVGLDIIDAGARGVRRLMRGFRPSATTLVI